MKAPTCALCAKKPIDPAYRPFCSSRCAEIDLGRWLSDSYSIPAVDNEAVAEEANDWRPPDR